MATQKKRILCSLFPFTLLIWISANLGVARGETVQDQCNGVMNLTAKRKEELSIEGVEWKTSDGAMLNFPHCKVFLAASSGEFSPNGVLLDVNQIFPWAAVLRVPACYNGARALFYRPGASFDLQQALGPASTFGRECTAVMNMWYPTGATAGDLFREAMLNPPNSLRMQIDAYRR